MLKLPRWRISLRTSLGLVLLVGLALGLIAESQRRERVRSTLEHPLLNAARDGDLRRVIELLNRGADVDSITNGRFPWTPLMEAAFRGHRDTVLELIRRGADLDHMDLDGFTAASVAADEGHWSIVHDLAAAGANLDSLDGTGKSTRDYAREAGVTGLDER